MKIYVIVQTVNDVYRETQMVTRNTEKEVIHYVGIVSSNRDVCADDVSIERIYSITDRGQVDEYNIAFQAGKLSLIGIPKSN